FFQELFGRLPRPCVLVFDNAERVGDGEAWRDVLADAFELVPQGVNVVLLGRGELPAFLWRHRARRHLAVIGGDALRLEPAEWQRMIGGAGADKPAADPELAARLPDLVSGWAAGLVLLLEWMRHEDGPPREPRDAHGLFEYFAAEVFARADAETQRFL